MTDSTSTPPTVPGKDAREGGSRRERFHGRRLLNEVSMMPACKKCGRVSILPGGGVQVRAKQQKDGTWIAGYGGLSSCGRVWLCPVCNAKVMARRALEIQIALAWAHREGLLVLWGSVTTRHNPSTRLGAQLEVQTAAWRFLMNSWGWRADSLTREVRHVHDAGCPEGCDRKKSIRLQEAGIGRVGYIRSSEINFGANGWHAHFHPMIFWRGSKDSAQRAAASIVPEWVAGVNSAGGEASDRVMRDGSSGQHLEVMSVDAAASALAEYVTKQVYDAMDAGQRKQLEEERGGARAKLRADRLKAAQELVWSQSKTGREGITKTASHWVLLDLCASGDVADLRRWWELEQATTKKRHRMITWSRGLRDFAGLAAEQTDEEVAAAEIGTAEDSVCLITAEGWRRMRDDADLCAEVLELMETKGKGWPALRRLLDRAGVEWIPLPGTPDDEPAVAFAAAEGE